MDVHGRPEIFNTDQGSQFTGHAFTGQPGGRGHTHLDGRVPDAGWTRCLSNGCGGSLKYECVFLNAFETGGAALDGIGRWLDYYNRRRPHSALGDRTPDEAYGIEIDLENLAA